MLSYVELNQAIYNHWLKYNRGNTHFMFLYDVDEHKEILNELQISDLEYTQIIVNYGKFGWYNYLKELNGLHQVYGLISLQLLVASKMTTSFNEILSEKFNYSLDQLQLTYNDYQERLWEIAKTNIENIGYKTTIPERKQYKGRFTQYPDSQSFLKKKDLIRFSEVFILKGLSPDDDWKYLDFKKELDLKKLEILYSKYLTNNFQRKLNSDQTIHEILYQQVYNYFNNRWLSSEKIQDYNTKRNSWKLIYEPGLGFNLMSNQNEVLNLNSNENLYLELLNKTNLLKFSKEIILEYNEQFNDYSSTKKINKTSKFVYLTFDFNAAIYNDLIKLGFQQFKPNIDRSYQMFLVDLQFEYYSIFANYISIQENKLEQISGVPIKRDKYLFGHGPKYLVKNQTVAYINGQFLGENLDSGKIIDCSNCPIGSFQLQVNEERDFNFQIMPLFEIDKPIANEYGWDISNLKFGGSDLVGQISKNNITKITPRVFINFQLNSKVSNRDSTDNLILKNLKNQKR